MQRSVYGVGSALKSSYLKLLAVGFWLLMGSEAISQSTLSGKVTDKATGEPVPFANVFFAYTTQGAATLADGTFVIQRIPAGSYDLLVEVVGYRRHKQPLEFNDGQYTIEISLEEESRFLDSVTVVADQSDKRYYPLFVKFFIGEGRMRKNARFLTGRRCISCMTRRRTHFQ